MRVYACVRQRLLLRGARVDARRITRSRGCTCGNLLRTIASGSGTNERNRSSLAAPSPPCRARRPICSVSYTSRAAFRATDRCMKFNSRYARRARARINGITHVLRVFRRGRARASERATSTFLSRSSYAPLARRFLSLDSARAAFSRSATRARYRRRRTRIEIPSRAALSAK